MAFAITAVEVEDYGKWREVFDANEQLRKEYGIRGSRIYQEVGNPNRITVAVEGDQSDLEAWYGSQALKDAMAEGGVVSPAEPSFWNEVT